MFRTTVFAASLFAGVTGLSAHETSIFHAGGQPDEAKSKPGDRGAIIDRLRSNYQDVVDRLNQQDSGARTLAKQKEIADLLKDLLDQDEPPPNSDSSPPPNSPPPNAKNPPQPPKPAPQDAAKTNNSAKQNAPAKIGEKPQPAPQPRPGNVGQNQNDVAQSPLAPLDLRTELERDGFWPAKLPQRQRASIEAGIGERFMPRYEDLLRAYYRTIAESSRAKRDE